MSDAIPMRTMPPATRRLGGFSISLGEPFVIASREQDPDEGTFVHPQLWWTNETLMLNWSFDRDMHDGRIPDKPNGRTSVDGGRTWKRQAVLAPPGRKIVTGSGEITSYWHSFPVSGEPGRYRVASWRSSDDGRSWGEMFWTEMEFPDTRGLDIYDPPEGSRFSHPAFKLGEFVSSEPPAYLAKIFGEAGTRRRGPNFHSIFREPDGTLHGLTYNAYYLPGGDELDDEEFWKKLDWSRRPILMQTSTDGGRSWTFRGVVAFDERHAITDFDRENVFTEPALQVFPDGEMICVMRTGSVRHLYLVRSLDGGETWSEPERLPIRGILPRMSLLPSGALALCTGRPHCAIHFSLDRGRTWPLGERLFIAGESQPDVYASSTCNNAMTMIDDHTLLYVHDAGRFDPDADHPWLKKAGFVRIIGRFITVEPSWWASRVAQWDKLLAVFKQESVEGEGAFPICRVMERDVADLALTGNIDVPFWKERETYFLRDVETGDVPRQKTSFQMAWTGAALRVAIRCEEDDMASLKVATMDDGDMRIWEGDYVELLIETPVLSYYQITINPAGAVVDADREGNALNLDWTSNVQVATSKDAAAWNVELVLPVGEEDGVAGEKPTEQSPWRFNLCRHRSRDGKRELSAFSPTGFPGWHERVTLGKLVVKEGTG